MEEDDRASGKSSDEEPEVRLSKRLAAERIKAAMRVVGLNQSQLARKARVRQPLVSELLRGKQQRCDRVQLERISDVLQVPTAWLTGETDLLPFQPKGRANLYRAIVESQFMTRCAAAYERDTRASRDLDAEGKARRAKFLGEFVFAMYDVMDHERWWRALLEPRSPHDEDEWDFPPDQGKRPRRYVLQEERTTEAVIHALELVLEPWLSGSARLLDERVLDLRDAQKQLLKEPVPPRA